MCAVNVDFILVVVVLLHMCVGARVRACKRADGGYLSGNTVALAEY